MSSRLPSFPDSFSEVDPQLVAALTEFDERLRAGAGADGESSPANLSVSDRVSDKLRTCLEMLESVWPRTPNPAGGTVEYNELNGAMGVPTQIGRFEILQLLGGGGFSLVYLAYDPRLNRKIALKVPRPHLLFDEDLTRRFLREAQAIGALDHPNILPVYESGNIGPAVYLAMAYCEGPNLATWQSRQAGPIPVRMAAEIVAALADAIGYSHQRGVLHRDLKPANVLLFPVREHDPQPIAGLPFVPKVADFGLAKLLEGALEDTRSSVVLGTPLYMAPEQATGKPQSIGPWTDQYGLGAILQELLTGQPPYSGDNVLEVLERLRKGEPVPLARLRADVPRDLQTICAKCLLKDPADRYENAYELRDDLRRFLEDRPITARPLGLVSRAVRVARKPTRVRDAGIYMIIMQISIAIWTPIAAVTTFTQIGTVSGDTDFIKGYGTGVLSSIVFSTPLIYFGWMILKRRTWAALAAVISGIVSLTYTVPFVLGYVPLDYGGQYKEPNSRILIFSLLSVLFFGQTFLGWLAYRVLRREQVASRQGKQ